MSLSPLLHRPVQILDSCTGNVIAIDCPDSSTAFVAMQAPKAGSVFHGWFIASFSRGGTTVFVIMAGAPGVCRAVTAPQVDLHGAAAMCGALRLPVTPPPMTRREPTVGAFAFNGGLNARQRWTFEFVAAVDGDRDDKDQQRPLAFRIIHHSSGLFLKAGATLGSAPTMTHEVSQATIWHITEAPLAPLIKRISAHPAAITVVGPSPAAAPAKSLKMALDVNPADAKRRLCARPMIISSGGGGGSQHWRIVPLRAWLKTQPSGVESLFVPGGLCAAEALDDPHCPAVALLDEAFLLLRDTSGGETRALTASPILSACSLEPLNVDALVDLASRSHVFIDQQAGLMAQETPAGASLFTGATDTQLWTVSAVDAAQTCFTLHCGRFALRVDVLFSSDPQRQAGVVSLVTDVRRATPFTISDTQ